VVNSITSRTVSKSGALWEEPSPFRPVTPLHHKPLAAVVAQPGALFDIAGGSVQFQAGYLQQSYLIGSDGRIYNVNTAPAGIAYFGVFQGFIANHPRWGITDRYGNVITQPSQIYEAGYTVGRDAGNLVNTVLPV